MRKIVLTFLAISFGLSVVAQDITLPTPKKTGGKPLMDALSQRQSHREFADKELDNQTLSDLLWATYGFNREDKRVVPSSQNRQELDLYVVLKSGVYFYDAKANKLIQKVKGDQRKMAASQAYAQNAPVNFIIVGNLDRASSRDAAYIDSGFLVQNAYLFCASHGSLVSVVRGSINKDEIKQVLNLTDQQEVTIAQTIGYKK